MKKILLLLSIIFILILTACDNTEGMPKFKYKRASTEATLKDDGYAIAELKACTDGDTATFKVGGLILSSRFLAIDTPETSHPTIGKEPWGETAKKYTCDRLTDAEQIILELDPESDMFDHYDRLLAWIWVDGVLLNYELVEEGYAYVKYLYGDYEYTLNFIKAETVARKAKLRIHGETDPNFDYDNKTIETSLANLRNIDIGKKVTVEGIVTAVIGNGFIIELDGHAIYVYTSGYKYNNSAVVGNHIKFTAQVAEYNSLFQLSSIEEKKIEVISTGNNIPAPLLLTLDQIREEYESRIVTLKGVTVTEIEDNSNTKGYNVYVEQNGTKGIIRIDKHLNPYIEPDFFTVGETLDVIGNVGQYSSDYQILIRTTDDIIRK